ncbi:MAG: FG-GAP repeat protein, partial [Xanthomonadales bacterium]|nr:FG-GAP repeat protein [Xanthomonadales bacterium]
AYLHDDATSNSGSAYVFTRSGTVWTQQQKLSTGDPGSNDEFGISVALSGDTIAAGAAGADARSGSAYVFAYDGNTWTQQKKLIAVIDQEDRQFGFDVAVDGDTALIGAPKDDHSGETWNGSAYLFARDGNHWNFTAKLSASNTASTDLFGWSVAIEGGTALIGAPNGDTVSADTGAAYIFVKPITGWVSGTETAVLSASDGAVNSAFGSAVALSGDTALVGRPNNGGIGSVLVFSKPPTGWKDGTESTQFLASDGNTDDYFGAAVDISGDTAIVGAYGWDPQATPNSNNPGAAYIYVNDGGWPSTENAILSNVGTSAMAGMSVAISDDTALVGIPYASFAGAAKIFVKPPGGWVDEGDATAELVPSGEVGGSGYDVTLAGDVAVVGSIYSYFAGTSSGSSHIFVKPASGWADMTDTSKLIGSDTVTDDMFGYSIAISGDTILTGVPDADSGDTDSGAAYFYRFECGFSGSVAPGRWTMFAIPCDLGTNNTVEDVFGDDFNTADYLYDWVVWKRDEANERYVRLTLASPLEIGQGYWIFSYDGGFWDAGNGGLTTFTQDPACASPRGCFEIPLVNPADASSEHYNMVGHPGNIQTDWASVTVLVDGVPYTPYDAEANNFVSNTLWKYNGNGYDSYNDITPGMIGYLDTYDGFWVKVLGGSFGKTVKLLVPYGTATGSPPGPPGVMLQPPVESLLEPPKPLWARLVDFFIPDSHAAKPTWDQEWYLRLIAISEDENLLDRNNVLGQLQESVNTHDRHDLVELNPFAPPYLSLVFPHQDWGDNAGNYTSDYHMANTGAADEWVFEIHSDDAYRNVDLYWDGLYLLDGIWSQDTGKKTWSQSKQMDESKLYDRMVLEDLDLGVEIPAVEDGVANHYSFSMNGQNVRSFRWVMESEKGKKPRTKPIKASVVEFTNSAGLDLMEQIPQPGETKQGKKK